jgi:hypothetical protein
MKERVSAKLDWNRMLGFEQIPEVRELVAGEIGSIDAKVGQKTGTKAGVKSGRKNGLKAGVKIGVKQGVKA